MGRFMVGVYLEALGAWEVGLIHEVMFFFWGRFIRNTSWTY